LYFAINRYYKYLNKMEFPTHQQGWDVFTPEVMIRYMILDMRYQRSFSIKHWHVIQKVGIAMGGFFSQQFSDLYCLWKEVFGDLRKFREFGFFSRFRDNIPAALYFSEEAEIVRNMLEQFLGIPTTIESQGSSIDTLEVRLSVRDGKVVSQLKPINIDITQESLVLQKRRYPGPRTITASIIKSSVMPGLFRKAHLHSTDVEGFLRSVVNNVIELKLMYGQIPLAKILPKSLTGCFGVSPSLIKSIIKESVKSIPTHPPIGQNIPSQQLWERIRRDWHHAIKHQGFSFTHTTMQSVWVQEKAMENPRLFHQFTSKA
jgi:hypothetical protein